jgi:hypothetical protein
VGQTSQKTTKRSQGIFSKVFVPKQICTQKMTYDSRGVKKPGTFCWSTHTVAIAALAAKPVAVALTFSTLLRGVLRQNIWRCSEREPPKHAIKKQFP